MNFMGDPSPPLVPPLTHVIYSATEIAAAVDDLAVEILAATPYADELVLLIVLEGARRFGEDLHAAMTALPQAAKRRIAAATVGASSYGAGTVSSGTVTMTALPSESLAGRHVVIVDDILDQGHTMRSLLDYCASISPPPATVKACVLFDKRDVKRDFRPDFVGLEVPPVFAVGYGLDYQENFRNLPYLAALDEALTERKVATDVQAPAGRRERA
jgi:hypoxanthine phosphoribosyltransferase